MALAERLSGISVHLNPRRRFVQEVGRRAKCAPHRAIVQRDETDGSEFGEPCFAVRLHRQRADAAALHQPIPVPSVWHPFEWNLEDRVSKGLSTQRPSRQPAEGAVSEAIATFGLLAVILGCARRRPDAIPGAVSAYIVAAYWFTASTSFANPAVTVARSLTATFAGIRTIDVAPFVGAQLAGAAAAFILLRWLTARPSA